MGEYATRRSDRKRIKIGTCEAMYHLRHEDIDKVIPDGGYSLHQSGLWFRLPLPKEDGIEPGGYDDYEVPVPLLPYTDPDTSERISFAMPEGVGEHPGNLQLHHPSGLLVNASCTHGLRLPEGTDELRAHWNGKTSIWWELYMLKDQKNEGLLPLVRCAFCRETFRTDWARVLPHIADEVLRDRLTDIAAANPIPPLKTA